MKGEASFYRGELYNRIKKREHDGGKDIIRSGVQNEPNLRTSEKAKKNLIVSTGGVNPRPLVNLPKVAIDTRKNWKNKKF
jgi:hypothetical protein